MKKKLQYMNELFNSNPYFRELSRIKKILSKIRFIILRIFKNTALIDYVQYNYFLLNSNGIKRFIDMRKRRTISDKLNNSPKVEIFDNKSLFNQYFSNFLKRQWIDMKHANLQDVEKLIKSVSSILVKPADGSFGIGIEKYNCSDIVDIEKFYCQYCKSDCVIEEVVEQHQEIAQFNVDSLNTFRIVTVKKSNRVDIFGAVFRIGRKGSIVDNHHSGGLSAIVDVENGIICSNATDQNFSNFIFHPDSNIQIIGYKIPFWDDIIATVKEAALVIDEVSFVGWDVGINTKSEPVIIEGNRNADPDVLQRADQEGKWFDIKKYLQ